MRRKVVAGNWKMNGHRGSNAALLASLVAAGAGQGEAQCLVFPPYTYLDQVAEALDGSAIGWGAQDVSDRAPGAFTGEIAAEMLLDSGCTHVLVGHSERRQWFGDTDAVVNAKARRAIDAGLVPVICVGETRTEREAGQTDAVIVRQMAGAFDAIAPALWPQLLVAYEPVWAIGTGLTASPQQAQDVHASIRAWLAAIDRHAAAGVRILYGGSVKAANAAALFSMPDVDGGLVGGASLDGTEFVNIWAAAAKAA
jgi:triosephosphate isomerase